ncbi:MAG: shikimate kinase [Bacteroidales bacterium]
MRIFLVGFMGAGKTTVGRKLARKLDHDFYDTDHVFEEKFRYTIYNFFEHFGEDMFRKLEYGVLQDLIRNTSDVVISTGGGTPCFYDNMDIMNRSGITVYLTMHKSSLKQRLIRSKRPRPALKGMSEEHMEKYIDELLDRRESYYSLARITVKGENCNVDDLCREIVDLGNANGHKAGGVG